MELRNIGDQRELDTFVDSQPRSQFLQSWAWGQFQRWVGRDVRRFGFFDGKNMVGAASVLIHRLPFRYCYWYVPRGPIVKIKDQSEKINIEEIIEKIVKRAREAGALFVRMGPPYSETASEVSDPRKVKSTQPQDTLYLDLSLSEDELLAQMHEKTRYNIRLAEKKGVTIRKSSQADLSHFWRINQETTVRDQFQSHGRSYYETMFARLPEHMVHLYLAEFEGQVIAANIVIHFGDTATYLHGASSNTSRNAMAPHLLQWEQMLDAKKAGFRWYDFWGIAASQTAVGQIAVSPSVIGLKHRADQRTAENHPWAGITRFKKGFGGEEVHFAATRETPIKPFAYRLYRVIRRFR